MNSIGKVSAVLLGLAFLAATSAHADPAPPYEPQIVPPGKVYPLEDGREVCGWLSIEDVQAAYDADADLVKCHEDVAAKTIEAKALGVQLANTAIAFAAETRTTEILQQRNKELTTDLIEENRLKEHWKAKPRWGNSVAWTTTAILAATLVGFVGADLIN